MASLDDEDPSEIAGTPPTLPLEDALAAGVKNASEPGGDGGGGADGSGGTAWPSFRANNRRAARLQWRCAQAARAASRLVPPLSARALLPAASAALPHSCAPAVRVPAGDPRTYSGRVSDVGVGVDDGWGGRPRAGVAGWPLTVAAVALRDLPAGAPLTCSWLDAAGGEDRATRIAMLEEFVPMTASSWAAGGGSTGRSSEGDDGGGGGGELCSTVPSVSCGPPAIGAALGEENGGLVSGGRSSACCECAKCLVEGAGEWGESGGSGASSVRFGMLLEAAEEAVGEDR